jgi:hypothetical protein
MNHTNDVTKINLSMDENCMAIGLVSTHYRGDTTQFWSAGASLKSVYFIEYSN